MEPQTNFFGMKIKLKSLYATLQRGQATLSLLRSQPWGLHCTPPPLQGFEYRLDIRKLEAPYIDCGSSYFQCHKPQVRLLTWRMLPHTRREFAGPLLLSAPGALGVLDA